MVVAGPPLFQRSPRLVPQVPAPEFEIPPPPSGPPQPSTSLSAVLLMLLPTLAGALVMYLIGRGRGGSPWIYVGMSLPMVAISAGIHVVRMLTQRRQFERQVEERERRYQQILESIATQAQQAVAEQGRILTDLDPDPLICAERVAGRSSRLWERSPGEEDFLRIRLGFGSLPAAVKVKAPRPPGAEEPDPLLLEALRIPEAFNRADGLPILLPLREAGVVGVVGPRAVVLDAVRSLLCHLAVHHAPDEAKVAAIFPSDEVGDWAWMRWLPHVWNSGKARLLAADGDGADRLAGDLYELLQRRKHRRSPMGSGEKVAFVPWYMVVLGDLSLVEKDPLLPLLLREGASLGAVTLVLAGRKEDLPKECRAIVQVNGTKGELILTSPALAEHPFTPDQFQPGKAEEMARSLAPIRLHQLAASAEIPSRVTLLDLLRLRRVEEVDALALWREAEPYRSLGVPLGMGPGGEPLLIDIHERGHGPHGLVAGATGSGKSELLQTLVAALAFHFHPHELALVLVDYKGGGMANAFAGLPHLVGTITNLGGNLTRRALAALKAELRRRQRLLGEAGVNQVDAYLKLRRRGQPLEPLPHLLMIVDEFAELKSDQPDFMRELVSAVRVGRSLGVHLILATQKPAGVVDEQIWSNARFRLCLRVERPEDSQEVLKSPDAAFITAAGRAYFQVGNNERFDLFQAGWGGAPYQPETEAMTDWTEICEVGLDGTRYPLQPQSRAPVVGGDGQAQLTVLLDHIRESAARAGIGPLAGPWLPPLPERVLLEDLCPSGEGWDGAGSWRPASTWMEIPVGMIDDPDRQVQEPLCLGVGKEGHLMVYGAPGSGKTTFLQTLVIALARRYSPADCQIYVVDAGGRSLAGLGALPHVGAVVLGDESERVHRLMRLLMQELEGRKQLLGEAGVNTLGAYRQTGGSSLPAVLLVLDSYTTFAQSYPDLEEQLAQIAREGGSLGLHLALAASGPSQIRAKVASNITMAVALQLTDRSDYGMVVGRTGGLEPMPVSGRGLIKGAPPLEFQTALPVAGEAEWQRAQELRALCQAMDQAWSGPRPRPVRTLPDLVSLAEAAGPACDDSGLPMAPVALEVESLDPFAVPMAEGPHFLVTGPAESGKTTLLQAWALGLAEGWSPDRLHLYLVDMGAGGLSALRRLPHVQAYAAASVQAESLVEALDKALQERRTLVEEARRGGQEPPGPSLLLSRFPALVVMMDDVEAFRDGASPAVRDRLEQMLRRDRGLGFHLVVAGLSSLLGQLSYEGMIKSLKEGQTGLVLGSTEHSDLQLLNIRIPGETGRLLPAGLGFYARRGRWRRIKVASPHVGVRRLIDHVERIIVRWNRVMGVE